MPGHPVRDVYMSLAAGVQQHISSDYMSRPSTTQCVLSVSRLSIWNTLITLSKSPAVRLHIVPDLSAQTCPEACAK